jgi:hypothetical protein
MYQCHINITRIEDTNLIKPIIEGRIRSRSFENQKTEARIGVAILNKMTNLGMPVSVRA